MKSTALLLALVASGCSLTVDADRPQCESDDDCQSRGGEFSNSVCVASLCQLVEDERWSCLGQEPVEPPEDGEFEVSVPIIDLVNREPIPDVRAKLCNKLDVSCERPLTEDPVVSDEEGIVSFTLPAGFDGFLELESDDIAPSLYFFNPPIAEDRSMPPLPLASPGLVALLAQQLSGGPLLEDRGVIVLTAADCKDEYAAGVRYETPSEDEATVTFYSVGELPTATATSTDMTGYGGIMNVPAGLVSVTGSLAEDDRELGTISLLVRPGTLTYSRMVPRGE